MNITSRLLLPLLLGASFLLTGCGQKGGLFLPGHGKGYYRSHKFTERPSGPLHQKGDIL